MQLACAGFDVGSKTAAVSGLSFRQASAGTSFDLSTLTSSQSILYSTDKRASFVWCCREAVKHLQCWSYAGWGFYLIDSCSNLTGLVRSTKSSSSVCLSCPLPPFFCLLHLMHDNIKTHTKSSKCHYWQLDFRLWRLKIFLLCYVWLVTPVLRSLLGFWVNCHGAVSYTHLTLPTRRTV